MRVISLSDFRSGVEARCEKLGIIYTPEMIESLRNKGFRRTPEKRAMLQSIEDRCLAAGISPIKAYF